MNSPALAIVPTVLVLALTLASCSGGDKRAASAGDAPADTAATLIASVGGLADPEAVRYDPEQDVYFVSNINKLEDGDSNGFVSKVGPAGEVIAREFMRGSPAVPLHGPRGMFITGDTLWVADALGVHGFDRHTGAALTFVDLSAYEPGFLNDIAQGPDGALYVTETVSSCIFRLAGGRATIAIESAALCQPNGITWDAAGGRFLLASWGPGPCVVAWTPGTTNVDSIGPAAGGQFDGIEILADGRILVASQADSSLHVIAGGADRVALRLQGQPADIAVDTKRGHVGVPMQSLHLVEIWKLGGTSR